MKRVILCLFICLLIFAIFSQPHTAYIGFVDSEGNTINESDFTWSAERPTNWPGDVLSPSTSPSTSFINEIEAPNGMISILQIQCADFVNPWSAGDVVEIYVEEISSGDYLNTSMTLTSSSFDVWDPTYNEITMIDGSLVIPNPVIAVFPNDGSVNQLLNVTLNWGIDPDATGYYLNLGTDNPPTNIVHMWDNGNVLTYNATGLTSNTTYYWQVVPYNNSGSAVGCPVWSFATYQTLFDTFPYEQTFDTSSVPLGWTVDPVVTGDSWEVANYEIGGHGAIAEHTGNGGYMMVIDDSTPQTVPAHLYSPEFDLVGLTNPVLSLYYWIGDGSNSSELHIDVISDTGTDASVAVFTNPSGAVTDGWTLGSVSLVAYTGQTVSFDFRGMESSSYRGDICLDDIEIFDNANPPTPTTLVAPLDNSSGQLTSGILEWNSVSNADGYYLYFGSDYPPTNIVYGGDQGTVLSYAYNNLTDSTTYYWQVTPYNANGNASNCPVWSFTTYETIAITYPYIQSFDSYPPIGYQENGTQNWSLYSSAGTPAPSLEASFWNWQVPNNAEFTTISFDATGINPAMSFDWSHHYDSSYPDDELDVSISIDNGLSWVSIWNETGDTFESNDGAGNTSAGSFITETVALHSYANTVFMLKFDAISGYGPDLFIDNLIVYDNSAPPNATSCISPLDGSIDQLTGGVLEWDVSFLSDGYKLSLGTDNPPTDIVNGVDQGNALTYDYNGLIGGTTYYWQIVPYNVNGDAVNCPIWSFITTSSPPNPVTYIAPSNGAVNQFFDVTLEWNEDSHADGYYINLGTDNPPTNIYYLNDIDDGITLDVNNLNGNTTYYWEVIPYNSNGNAIGYETWSFSTTANLPDVISLSTPNDTATGVSEFPVFSWSIDNWAQGYYLYLSDDNSNFTQTNLGLVNEYTLTNQLVNELTYYWYVTGYNDNGESPIPASSYSFTVRSNQNYGGDGTLYGGYYFANSKVNGNGLGYQPTYDWIDISTTGIVPALIATSTYTSTDEGYTDPPIPLGFTFNYFGNEYSSVYISSNGTVMFSNPTCNYTEERNMTIPDNSSPNDVISLLAMDLDLGTIPSTYFYGNDDWGNFVFTALQWCDYGDTSEYVDVQLILYPTGRIKIQYRNYNNPNGDSGSDSIFGDVCIGIENADGTIGHEYRNNEIGGPVIDNMALCYAASPEQLEEWLWYPSCNPTDGETDLQFSGLLDWNEAVGATGYRLSFGSDNPPADILSLYDNGNSTNYSFADLQPLTTYYWQVTPYDANGDYTSGPIWSFTTYDGCMFREDWENDIDPVVWKTWGSPVPLLRSGEGFNGTDGFDANGDSSYQSGATTYQTFDLTERPSFEFVGKGNSSYPHWQNLSVAWSSTIADDFNGTSSQPADLIGIMIQPSTDDLEVRYFIPDEYYVELWTDNEFNDIWISYRVQINSDNTVSFYRNGSHVWTSTNSVDVSLYTNQALVAHGRSYNTPQIIDDIEVYEFDLSTSPPLFTSFVQPMDGQDHVPINGALEWNSSAFSAGYYVSLGTDNPPTNVFYMSDAETNLYHDFNNLQMDTTYYWQVVPYNQFGNAVNCPIWSFETEDIVQLSGQIIASDTSSGIVGLVELFGDFNYTVDTDNQGYFTLPVQVETQYSCVASADGYYSTSVIADVGVTDLDLGQITVQEITYPATNAISEVEGNNVRISWNLPYQGGAGNVSGYVQGFENEFPPTGWSVQDTNPDGSTFLQFGTVAYSPPVVPTEGSYQTGVQWAYTNQDEWLKTYVFTCPENANLTFDFYGHYGSTNQDHYEVKVTTDGGANWASLWDASLLPEADNHYTEPVILDLSPYAGQSTQLAWHFYDGPTDDGLWYSTFIDNVSVGNTTGRTAFNNSDFSSGSKSKEKVDHTRITQQSRYRNPFEPVHPLVSSSNPRSLLNYTVYRLLSGEENDSNSWEELATVTDTTYVDMDWNIQEPDVYKWAVRANYTNNAYSPTAFTNIQLQYLFDDGEVSYTAAEIQLDFDEIPAKMEPSTDVDWYLFWQAAPATLSMHTEHILDSNVDLMMHLYGPYNNGGIYVDEMSYIASDDNSYDGTNPWIETNITDAGFYYLRVTRPSNQPEVSNSRLIRNSREGETSYLITIETDNHEPQPNNEPYIAINPIPLDGEDGVPIGLNELSWEYIHELGYTYPVRFKVYFDTDNDFSDVSFISVSYNGDGVHTCQVPTQLQNSSTYYWQVVPTDIDDVRTSGSISGSRISSLSSVNFDSNNTRDDATNCPIWSFTTTRVPMTIIVPLDFATIQDAIVASIDGDTISVHPGVYNENLTINNKSIKLTSLFETTNDTTYIETTVLNGNFANHCVSISSNTGQVEINGFEISYGNASYGGGLYCYQSDVLLKNCMIRENQSNNGAGIYSEESNIEMEYCQIFNNNAGRGGGFYSMGDSNITTNFCTIAENMSSMGGNCFYVNGALEGKFVNSIFHSNGPSEVGFTGSPSTLDFYYSLISQAPTAIENDNGSTVSFDANCIEGNPQFNDIAMGDFSLSYLSPCINAGTAYLMLDDEVFVDLSPQHYFGSAPDMGAIELPGDFIPSISYTPQSIDLGELYSGTLVNETITVSNTSFADLVISNILAEDAELITSIDGVTIQPLSSEDINLTGTVQVLGDRDFNITFNTNVVGSETINIPVTGSVVTPPSIFVQPDELDVLVVGSSESIEYLAIENEGGTELSFTLSTNQTWLTVPTDEIVVDMNETYQLPITLNTLLMVQGVNNGTVTFMTNDPDNPIFDFNVTVRKEYLNYTNFDNMNNQGEFSPDNDLSVSLGHGSAIQPVEFAIYSDPNEQVNTVDLIIRGRDIDSALGERCIVYLNENQVGVLTGLDVTTSINNFPISPDILSADGINIVKIELDVDMMGDNLFIDSGQLIINNEQGDAHIRSVNLDSSRYYPGSSVAVIEEIDTSNSVFAANINTTLTQSGTALSNSVDFEHVYGSNDDAITVNLGIPITAEIGTAFVNIYVLDSLGKCHDYLVTPLEVEPHVPDIDVSISEIDFGVTPDNVPVVREFTIANSGLNTLSVTSIGTNIPEYTVVPNSADILPGNEQLITVTFLPQEVGNHDGFLTIASNDDDESFIVLNLYGEAIANIPYLESSIDALEFGDVFNVIPETKDVIITNSGPATLDFNWESTEDSFIIQAGTASLETGETHTLEVTFAPQSSGQFNGQLNITSNAPNAPTLAINMVGTGILAPEMQLSNQAYNLYLQSGVSHTENLQVQNTGLSDLIWKMHQNMGNALQLDGNPGDSQYGVIDNSSEIQLFDGEFTVETWFKVDSDYSQSPTGVITSNGTGIQYIISKSDESSDGFFGIYTNGLDSGDDKKELHLMMRAPNDLLHLTIPDCIEHHIWYQASVVYSANQVHFYLNQELVAESTLSNYNGNTDPWVVGKLLPIDRRWYRLNGSVDDFRVWDDARTETEIFMYSHTRLIGDETGLNGYWSMDAGLDDTTQYANDGVLFGSYELERSTLTDTPEWLTSSLPQGNTTQSTNETLVLIVNTASMITGDYTANIMFESNDPINSEVFLPINLVVTGTANIALTPDNLDFGTVVTAITDTLSFSIINTGTDNLEIYNISSPLPAFTPSITTTTIVPGSSERVIVSFTPDSDIVYNTDLIVSTSLSPSDYQIGLLGEGVLPPSANVQPAQLALNMQNGTTGIETIQVSNAITQGTQLEYYIEIEETSSRNNVEAEYANIPQNIHGMAEIFGTFYLIDYDDSQLVKYDKDTEQVLETIDIHLAPWGIAKSNEGYWIGSSSGTFYHFDLNDTLLGTFSNDLMTNPAFCCDGTNLYITDSSIPYAQVYKVSSDGTVLETYNRSFSGAVNALTWVESHETGQLWALNSDNNQLRRLRIGNTIQHQQLINVPDWGTSYSICHDGRDLYVAGLYNTFIHRVDDGINEFSWLSYSDYSGVVNADTSENIDFIIDATSLFAGNYFANINITTNDPNNRYIVIPVQLSVSADPEVVYPSAYDLETVYTGEQVLGSIVVSNNGYADLSLTNFSSDLPEIQFQQQLLNISPWSQQSIEFMFTANASGQYSGNIQFNSNDPEHSMITILITANAVGEPVIQINQTSFQAALHDTEVALYDLVIENIGGTPLSYQIQLDKDTSRRVQPQFRDGNRDDLGDYAPEEVINVDSITDRIDFNPSQRTLAELYDVLPQSVPANSSGMAWINDELYILDRENDQLLKWNETQAIWYSYPVHDEAYSLTYDGSDIWISNQSGYVYSYDAASLMSTGNSFDTGFSDFSSITFNGTDFYAVSAGDINPVIRTLDYQGNILSEYIIPEQGLLTQIIYVPSYLDNHLWAYFFPAVDDGAGNIIYPTAEIIRLELSGSTAHIVEREDLYDDRKCDALAFDGRDFFFCDYDGPIYKVDDGFWLSAQPYSGIVESGSSESVEIALNSNHLNGGQYNGNVYITSNDPQNSVLTIPVSMFVTGIPDIALSSTSLDFGLVTTITPEERQLEISNEGTDALVLSNIQCDLPEFTVSDANMVLEPGQTDQLTITFNPNNEIEYTGLLLIETNIPDNPSITVNLTGSGIIARPEANITVNEIVLGTVNIGDTGRVGLEIENTGLLDLSLNPISTETSVFSPEVTSLNIQPSDIGTLWVLFQPVNSGEANDVLTIYTNDQDNPLFEIALSGIGFEPDADMIVSSETVDFGLINVGDTGELALNISNIGIGTLYISDITFDNNLFDYVLENTILETGQNSVVNVLFSPIDELHVQATMTIHSNDLTETEKVIALSGTGQYVPSISLDQTSFEWFITDENIQNNFLSVTNNGLSDLYILTEELDSRVPWLSVSPDSLAISPNNSADITLTVNTIGLDYGLHNAEFRLRTNVPDNRIIDIPLLLSYGGYNFTTNDNENNLMTGIADNDLDININEQSALAPVEFNIFIDEPSVTSAQLRIRAKDIDNNEVSQVYLNNIYLGDLKVSPDNWNTSYFNLDPSILNTSPSTPNTVRIDLDVTSQDAGSSMIDSGLLILNSLQPNAMINNLNLESVDVYQGSSVAVSYELSSNLNTQDVIVYSRLLSGDTVLDQTIIPQTLDFNSSLPLQSTLNIPPDANPGTYQIEITLYDPAKGSDEDVEAINVEVDAYAPQVMLVNQNVDFQNCFIGVTETRNAVIYNNGYAPLILDNIQVSGDGYSYLDVQPFNSQLMNNMRDRTISVPVEQSQTLSIAFTAINEGVNTGQLTFTSNDPAVPVVTVSLTAEASYPPQIGFNPLNISKTVYLGMSNVDSLLISNNGQGNLYIYNIIKNNLAWLNLEQTSMTIPPAGSSYLRYTADAGQMGGGHYLGQLTFLTNEPGNETLNLQAHLEVIDRPVIAQFSVDNPSGPAPHLVQFTDSSTTIDNSTIVLWEWDFDSDGIIDSNEQNPSYQYLSKGYYDVSLTVTNENGISNTAVYENYVHVLNTPPSLISNIPDMEIVVNSSNNDLNLNNYFNDADNDPLRFYATGQSHSSVIIQNGYVTINTYSWQGIEQIVFTCRDDDNAAVTDTISVRIRPVNEAPILSLPDDITILMNTSSVVDFADYIYDSDQTDDELTLTFTDNIHTHFNVIGTDVTISADSSWSGVEVVTVNVSDNQGRSVTSDTLSIEVLDALVPQFTVDNLAPWGGEEIYFTDLTEGNVTVWEWDFESDGTPDLFTQHPNHTYNISGDYYVTLTVRSEPGGTAYSHTSSTPIVVNGTGVPGGDIIDETWSPASSPYNVFGQVSVPATGRLQVEPGVVVNVFTDDPFLIEGELIADGATFTTELDTNWGGFMFMDGSDSSDMSGCIVLNADTPLTITGGSPEFSDMVFLAAPDTLNRSLSTGTGLSISGATSPILSYIEVSGYGTGLVLDTSAGYSPSLNNITIDNPSLDGTGCHISGAAIVDSLEIIDYETGLLLDDDDQVPTLTNVRIRNSENSVRNLREGLLINGFSSANITGLDIEGYGTAILMDNDSATLATPTLTNVRVRNSENSVRTDTYGIYVSGSISTSLIDVETDNFNTGVYYEQLGTIETTPTLTNVRIRNSENSSRNNGEGFILSGSVSATIDSLLVEDYESGILLTNDSATTATPTLTNVRVRNSENSVRPDTKGLVVTGSLSPTIDGLEIEDMSIGLELYDVDSSFDVPTLTNVRVRNSENSSRVATKGISISGSCSFEIDDCEIENYPQGIELYTDNSANMTTPVLTNIRVRNSENSSRPIPLRVLDETVFGLKASGRVNLQVRDYISENTGNGLVYLLDGDLGREVPTLTNVRVRNSENSVRPNSYGFYLRNIPRIYCDSDTLSGIDYGLVFDNRTSNRATPTLTNVRIRNSENSSRLTGIGLDLGNNVDALIEGCKIDGFHTGVKVRGTNNSTISSNLLTNNAVGFDLNSTLSEMHENVVIATSDMASQMISAVKVVNNAELDVSKFTIDNYPHALEAQNVSVNLDNSIIWSDSPIAQPYDITNAIITARYCDSNTTTPVAGIGNLNVDPMFTDAANGDYSLYYQSPLIDAGDIDSDGDGWTYYDGDMDDSDPDGTRLDMGGIYYHHEVSIIVDDQTIIQGTPSVYHADIHGHIPEVVTISWDFGDGGTSTQQDVTYTYANSGVYSVRLIVASDTLIDTVYHENHVLVSQLPLPAPQNFTAFVAGNNIILNWDPIVNDYYGNPVTVNHYLIYWSDSPDSEFRYLGDSGLLTTYTDQNVRHSMKYYKLIGFVGDLRALNEYLTQTRGVLALPTFSSSSNSGLRSSRE